MRKTYKQRINWFGLCYNIAFIVLILISIKYIIDNRITESSNTQEILFSLTFILLLMEFLGRNLLPMVLKNKNLKKRGRKNGGGNKNGKETK